MTAEKTIEAQGNLKILNQGYPKRIKDEAHRIEITKEDWDNTLSDFHPYARGDAANLAAHNWCIHLDGELLICSGPGFGEDAHAHSISKDYKKKELDLDYAKSLFPNGRKYLYFETLLEKQP